ncbi:C-factor [Madurella fahalii]|uniref:C-factor n=1 Tax=Madurella fahalii TaxID=1157608 RepID=A0ABQ0FZW7_9PEZI
MASFLITGVSRGFGLALVRELVSLPTSQVGKVIGTVRGDVPPALSELVQQSSGRVAVVKLDVTDQASIKKAAAEVETVLGDKGLDVLINNAGVCYWAFNGIQTMDDLQESFNINVMGVHWVTREFIPLLRKGTLKKVVNISTTLGSITLARHVAGAPCPAYKISKAAMNALTVQYALEYEKEGFTFMALSPGWMKTDLGGGDADLTPEQGAKASLDIIFNRKDANGTFPKVFVKGWENAKGTNVYDGTDSPW